MLNVADKTVRLDIDAETVNALDAVASRLKKKRGTLKIGVGTVAAELVETIFRRYPDLIDAIFELSVKSEPSDGSDITLPPREPRTVRRVGHHK